MKKQIWPTVIQGSRRQRLGPHGIHPVRRSLVFFCLKRACSFTVGIYNDVAMMFNNAYLFNVIYVYNYIYNNAVYIPGSLVFLPWRALVRHACWNSKDSLANQFLISLFEMAHACTLGMYRWIQETIERFQHPNMSVGSKLFKAANIV